MKSVVIGPARSQKSDARRTAVKEKFRVTKRWGPSDKGFGFLAQLNPARRVGKREPALAGATHTFACLLAGDSFQRPTIFMLEQYQTFHDSGTISIASIVYLHVRICFSNMNSEYMLACLLPSTATELVSCKITFLLATCHHMYACQMMASELRALPECQLYPFPARYW